ncbi:hypothetical protein A2716_00820 [candidate division WWE3 bacterium RIFCSPHIGHO2_01_FULL_40_23]|uniref:Uncharacterized protein n=1 Tax=candidate division WWE3 bacterium RIFCSPLOWO2_01_FULL_41_18 TaxID=1802625 RepID=A0A1F4VFQ3_UNCKA|nr:MAG: hypothetical protein A2716_00820 [candidate division WWE3 bacterium RIFCSPHIGHO2_01_FULL_40_23]OGC55533.1 MAG: hypothetical protein A3A78_01090 [candidate division WWE3 bacterium RIFCSPLOWO2_01_FULL_41_18]
MDPMAIAILALIAATGERVATITQLVAWPDSYEFCAVTELGRIFCVIVRQKEMSGTLQDLSAKKSSEFSYTPNGVILQ